jgi:hypothetical protein
MIQEPKHLHLPEMPFPKKVQQQIDVVNQATQAWAEEDSIYAEKQQALTNALNSDAAALKKAALAGEKDPGTKQSDAAERAVAYQEERVKAAVRDVNKETAVLSGLLAEHRLELMDTACTMAEAGITRFESDVAEIKVLSREAEERRHTALAPLRWVSRFTGGELSYDPSFPVDGSFQVPRTAELKANGIVSLLRKVFLQKDDEAA